MGMDVGGWQRTWLAVRSGHVVKCPRLRAAVHVERDGEKRVEW